MKFSNVFSWSGLRNWVLGPSAPDHHALAREARERAQASLPLGERLVDSHVVAIGEGVPAPPTSMRPNVFPKAVSTGDRWIARAQKTEDLLDRLNPVNAAVDAFDNRGKTKETTLSGDWESMAGHMARVLQPREECDATSVLLLTDHALHVVHVQKSPDGRAVGPGVQYGWGVPRRHVTWVRKRNNAKHGTHEIGFDDGSWTSFFLPVAGWGTLVAALTDLNSGSDRA